MTAGTDQSIDRTKRPVPRQRARRSRPRLNRVLLIQIGLIAAILVAWELASGRVIDPLMVSRPSDILPTFWDWAKTGYLFDNAQTTFKNAGLGLLVGGCVGLMAGCILGQSKRLAEIFEPFITAIYTTPKTALIPLFIVWVGIGSALSVLTSAVIVFFLIFFNTFFGVRDVSADLINSVLIMGGGVGSVLVRVRLPSALIWVVAGLKLAVPQAIVGVVVAEMLAGNSGLGYLVALNAGMYNTDGTFAAILALVAAGYAVDRIVTLLTKPALAWKNA